MFRLLLCISALGLLADAVQYTSVEDIRLSKCPVTYYGSDQSFVRVDTSVKQIKLQAISPSEKISFNEDLASDYEVDEVTDISSLPQDVKDVIGEPTCVVQIKLTLVKGGDAFIYLYTDASIGYVAVKTSENPLSVTASSSGPGDTLDVPASSVKTLSVDACYSYDSDTIYSIGSMMGANAETCTNKICLGAGSTPDVSYCNGAERCFPNEGCEEFKYCSVLGPVVIDFNGGSASQAGTCDYKLFEMADELTVVGRFDLRRLTDTPFLTDLTFSTKVSTFFVKGVSLSDENGAVTAPKTIGGVEITKSDEGFTFKADLSNDVQVTMFFDGTLLHITHGGKSGSSASVSGLCGDAAGSFKEASSEATCETLDSDPKGDGIDTTAVTAKCQDKLTAVSSTGTGPFKTACITLFGSYPDEDGVFCHMLDAFARSSGITSWRDAAGCPVSGCVTHQCASHEYCALSDAGNAMCRCKVDEDAINTLRTADQLGDKPTCSDSSVTVSLYTCLLEEQGYDPTGLHLLSDACTGTVEDGMIDFTYGASNLCDGTYETGEETILFKNKILNTGGDGEVTFEDTLSVSLECTYDNAPRTEKASFRVADGSVSVTVESVAFSEYTVSFGLFSDEGFTTTVASDTPLALNQLVYAKIETTDIGGDALALVLQKCYCTPTDDANAEKKYELITDRCPAPTDNSVMMLTNGVGKSTTFRFNAFSFIGDYGVDVYMHCEFNLCVLADGNCAKDCSK